MDRQERRTPRLADAAGAVIAVLGWSALTLQYALSIGMALAAGRTWVSGAVTYFSFFTILTNTLVAVVLTVPVVAPGSRAGRWLASPRTRSATATYIAVVGLVYSLALRQVWDPQGAQLVADRLLHDVIPVLYLVFWAVLVEKGQVGVQDVIGWLAYPLAYTLYTLARGALVGWYPYPFLDVTRLGYARTFQHIAVLTGGFLGVGLLVVAVDRLLSAPHRRMGAAVGLVAAVLMTGCRRPGAEPAAAAGTQAQGVLGQATSGAPGAPADYVGRTWTSTDAAAAPGTIRIFLPDGTLVMDSCAETYRLAPWRRVGEGRIEWQEDAVRIEADVAQPVPDQLQLRLHLGRPGGPGRAELKTESYRLARVPSVCPDARPDGAAAAVRVDGTLVFLERLALPPSAVIRAELRDTARADAPATVLAAQTLSPSEGPPFRFAFVVPATAIGPRANLSVFGEILDGTRRMFITDTRQPVPREGATGLEVRLRFVASAAGDPAPGVVTPVPVTYRCGDERFGIAFEADRAYVTLPDRSLVTLDRLAGGDPGRPRTFTNGRLTFTQETEGARDPRVLFARGRLAPAPCAREH